MRRILPAVLLLAAACGKKGNDSTVPPDSWNDSSPTGSGTGTGTGSHTGGSGGSGTTGEDDVFYKGDAAIDLAALTWTGTESAEVYDAVYGALVCQWTWNATDWAHDTTVTGTEPTAPACTDADGNACTFAFTVNLAQGAQMQGDCSTYGFEVDGGAFHYGYSDDWSSGGTSLGAQFAYYAGNGTTGDWFPAFELGYGTFIWTPGTGQDGQLHYELERQLLDAYATP